MSNATSAGSKSDLTRLLEMLNGYQQTSVIVAALRVGLLERLAEGPANVETLSRDLKVHAPSLSRLLNGLQVLGMVQRAEDQVALTNLGKLLKKGGFGVYDWARLVGEEYLLAWANLHESVKTGDVAFEKTFGTTAWAHRKEHPELNEAFNRVTSGVQLRNTKALLNAYDFSGRKCIVDVGGGHGNLLAGVLAKYLEADGILFDQPHVVEGATASLTNENIRSRVRVVGGSFLESVPAGGDAYLMKHCLHNWDDATCVKILGNCRAAMSPSSVLLVLENVMPQNVEGAAPLVMLDLHMMAVLGGCERTEQEYDSLARQAGLKVTRAIATRDGSIDILELEIAEMTELTADQEMTWSKAMGIHFVKATGAEVVAEINVGQEHRQAFGLVHGGVYCGLIESAVSMGASIVARARNQSPPVGLENHTSFVRAASIGMLRVTATPIRSGRTSQIWEATIRDDKGETLATGRVRLISVPESTSRVADPEGVR